MKRSRMPTRQDIIESLYEQPLWTALHLFVREQIGLLPESVNMTKTWMVLDVACGLGHWVRDMAEQYFNRTVIGIEKQSEVVNAARWLTPSKRAKNAHFQV